MKITFSVFARINVGRKRMKDRRVVRGCIVGGSVSQSSRCVVRDCLA